MIKRIALISSICGICFGQIVWTNTSFHIFGNSTNIEYTKVYQYTNLVWSSVVSEPEDLIEYSLASDFNFTTNLSLGTVMITGYKGTGGQVNIPPVINNYPVKMIDNNSFKSKTTITGMIIPNSVTNIGVNAMQYTSNLKSVVLPTGLKTLSDGVLNGSGITNIVIPEGVITIGDGALGWCTKLTNVVLASTVTTLETMAFRECSILPRVDFPPSVTNIGLQLFTGCINLRNVTIPETVKVWDTDSAFGGCSSLTNVNIEANIPIFKRYMFHVCSKLTTVTASGNVTDIQENAFKDCTILSNLNFSMTSLQRVGDSAFQNCTKVDEIVLPEGFNSLGVYAFEGCLNLSSL